jgi:hypothetical protein
VSRRSAIKVGLGVAAGTGLAIGSPFGATSASAAQNGTALCDNSGDSASVQGLGSGDLCIPYYRGHDGTWGYVWGDSYSGMDQANGTYLGSPAMLCQNSFDSSGGSPISFTWAMPTSGKAAQLFNYTHNADNGWGYEVSRIPNDCIEINGRTFIQYTSVNNWASKGDGSLLSGIAYSDDYGVTWQDLTSWRWNGNARGVDQSLYMMWSFAGIDADGWLYIFSKRWNGSHNNAGDGGAIQLFRYQPTDFYNGNWGAQQNWAYVNGAWTWTTSAPPSIILQGDNIGEFSVKNIGGTYCMSYFDCGNYSISTRTATRPDKVWTNPTVQISGLVVPHLYGGYIHPGSANADSLTLIVSQWDGTIGDRPYWALQYDGINP